MPIFKPIRKQLLTPRRGAQRVDARLYAGEREPTISLLARVLQPRELATRPEKADTFQSPSSIGEWVMIELRDAERGTQFGTITERQLKFLVDALEEESARDQDYYINADTIAMLEAEGADADLIGLLRRALGNREGIDIRWSRT